MMTELILSIGCSQSKTWSKFSRAYKHWAKAQCDENLQWESVENTDYVLSFLASEWTFWIQSFKNPVRSAIFRRVTQILQPRLSISMERAKCDNYRVWLRFRKNEWVTNVIFGDATPRLSADPRRRRRKPGEVTRSAGVGRSCEQLKFWPMNVNPPDAVP